MNLLLDAALGYAAWGIPVYPVHWPTRGGGVLACSCPRGPACDRPAKHPLLRHGVKDATTDPQVIGRWWHRWPGAKLGRHVRIATSDLDAFIAAGRIEAGPAADSPKRRSA
jgi:Bifunctional DNA primase/polymerase, N-terminal